MECLLKKLQQTYTINTGERLLGVELRLSPKIKLKFIFLILENWCFNN